MVGDDQVNEPWVDESLAQQLLVITGFARDVGDSILRNQFRHLQSHQNGRARQGGQPTRQHITKAITARSSTGPFLARCVKMRCSFFNQSYLTMR
jgi:hypothetical protein